MNLDAIKKMNRKSDEFAELFHTVTMSICALLAFTALCVASKACNDSDNALKTKVIEAKCSYIGDSKFICGGLVTSKSD